MSLEMVALSPVVSPARAMVMQKFVILNQANAFVSTTLEAITGVYLLCVTYFSIFDKLQVKIDS